MRHGTLWLALAVAGCSSLAATPPGGGNGRGKSDGDSSCSSGACVDGEPCVIADDPCAAAYITCGAAPACVAAASQIDGTSCGPAQVCAQGACVDEPSDFTPQPHDPLPQLPPHAASVIANLHLVGVVAANDDQLAELAAFIAALPCSSWWSAVGGDYGLSIADSTTVVVPAIEQDLDGKTLGAFVADQVARAAGPSPDASTLYVLFLPAGVRVVDNGVAHDCPGGDAFHAMIGGTNPAAFAVVQRCQGNPWETPLETVTMAASHEIAEAATDERGGQGYVLDRPADPTAASPWLAVGDEVGDLCTRSVYPEGGFLYQRIWSNVAAAGGGDPCVPAIAAPYESVATPSSWIELAAGQTRTITMYGWSTAPTTDWPLRLYHIAGSSAVSAQLSSATQALLDGETFPTTNNAMALTVSISASATATPGTWAVYSIQSYRDVHATSAFVDEFHRAPFGVVVR